MPQVATGHVELDHTSVDLTESKGFKLHLSSFNQTRFNNRDEAHQTLERDLSTCAQGKVSMALYRSGELGGQPIGRFNGTCIDDQDITIDNYEFTTDYPKNATSDEKVVEETLVNHLLKSNRLVTHQPDQGSIQIQHRGRQIDREKLLCYLVSFRHHDGFHEQCVKHIPNDLLRPYQPEKLSVYARYTYRGGLNINPWRSNNDFIPSTIKLIRR